MTINMWSKEFAAANRTVAGVVFQNSKGGILRTLGTKDSGGYLAEVLKADGSVAFIAHQGDWFQVVGTKVPSPKGQKTGTKVVEVAKPATIKLADGTEISRQAITADDDEEMVSLKNELNALYDARATELEKEAKTLQLAESKKQLAEALASLRKSA